ncbi:hypothetical protein [Halocatena marina]|uniref:hypothetical protein n=1 Tax=Halocatena marina TaxID=2934937 RepID=UPI00200BC8B1|nr:hypothetical protein [Halocatena marina]
MPRKHGETGDFIETVTLDAVVGVFDTMAGPAITSSDVADSLGCTPETAREKLTELHRGGRIERRKSAGRIVWWRTDETTDTARTRKRLSQELDATIIVGDVVYKEDYLYT